MKKIESLSPTVITALYPSYDQDGDGTNILYYSGSLQRVNKRIQTILKHIANHAGISIPILRKTIYGRQLFGHPLPIDKNHIFIPIKVRNKPIGRDGTLGYINFYTLTQCKCQTIDKEHMHFDFPQQHFTVQCSYRTWCRKLALAHYLHINQVAELSKSAIYNFANISPPYEFPMAYNTPLSTLN